MQIPIIPRYSVIPFLFASVYYVCLFENVALMLVPALFIRVLFNICLGHL